MKKHIPILFLIVVVAGLVLLQSAYNVQMAKLVHELELHLEREIGATNHNFINLSEHLPINGLEMRIVPVKRPQEKSHE